jgi:hypothetical protein
MGVSRPTQDDTAMTAALFPFVPHDRIERAVTVLDIGLGRGLPYDRALIYAVESLDRPDVVGAAHVQRLVESSWRKRSERLGRPA